MPFNVSGFSFAEFAVSKLRQRLSHGARICSEDFHPGGLKYAERLWATMCSHDSLDA